MNDGLFQFLLKKKEVHKTRATSVTSLVRTDSVSRIMCTDNSSPCHGHQDNQATSPTDRL